MVVSSIIAVSLFQTVDGRESSDMVSDETERNAEIIQVPGMVHIPGGEFKSGTTEEEKNELARMYDVDVSWFVNEPGRSRAQVEAFYIDRHEVTNGQFKAFMEATGYKGRPAIWDWREGFENLPVCGVSYDMAVAYAKWAAKRLPTALEWEKAARGTDGRRYPWGDDWDDEACDHAVRGVIPYLPKPVGYCTRDVSPYGVCGCAGGVAEWAMCELSWTNRPHPDMGWCMGGAFVAAEPYNFRCSNRSFSQMRNNRTAFAGFRCALDASKAARWVSEHPEPVLAVPGGEPVAFSRAVQESSEKPIALSAAGTGPFVSIQVPLFGNARFSFQVPEVIFSNRGAIFIGHKMRDAGWQVSPDRRSARLKYSDGEKMELRGSLKTAVDCVDYELVVTNIGAQPIEGVIASSCLASGGEPRFRDPEQRRTQIMTEKGWSPISNVDRGPGIRNMYRKYLVAGSAYARAQKGSNGMYVAKTRAVNSLIAVAAIDREWVVGAAAEEGGALMSNGEYTCIHSEPYFGSVSPGEKTTRRGRLYFLRGTTADLEKRAVEDGLIPER